MSDQENPESQEQQIINRITAAQSFEDLFSTYDDIDRMGVLLGGSKEKHTGADLKQRTQLVRKYREVVQSITRTGGVRDKVIQLMEQERQK